MRTVPLSTQHKRHLATLRSQPAVIDEEGLRIGGQYVMFFAEADLMLQHVHHLTAGTTNPDVLEVGLGLGVFAEQLVATPIASYTAVEPHEDVVRLTQERILHKLRRPAVITEPWQLVTLPAVAYDAIMYDTWPPDGQADADFAAFVEQVAKRCLRPGGRFSFFHSGTVLSDIRREVLDRHFSTWSAYSYSMPAELTPTHWTKPTRDFLIPVATKGGR
jgi:spermidine synthase